MAVKVFTQRLQYKLPAGDRPTDVCRRLRLAAFFVRAVCFVHALVTRKISPCTMAFRICKRFEVESGHILSKHPGKCRFPHGHSRRIEVVLVADYLDANDMVCDFKAIKESLGEFLARWDHALCLNSADPQLGLFQQHYGERVVVFTDTDPTSEVLARAVFEETRRRLGEASGQNNTPHRIPSLVRVERVRVTETSSSWAEYFE